MTTLKKKLNSFSPERSKDIITPDTTVFWMRRDLRLKDNAGLYHALRENKSVIPIFIFDSVILDKLEDRDDRRVEFILQSLNYVQQELANIGSTLVVFYGNPVEVFREIRPAAVYTNHDYESYAISRDAEVGRILSGKNIPFKTYKDHVIFEKTEVVKNDGKPYTVFTPYSRMWKARLNEFYYRSYPTEKYFKSFKQASPLSLPELKDIGFTTAGVSVFPPRLIRKSLIEKYDQNRNFPAIEGTTKLGVHLRFGTVSIRELVRVARSKNETWLNELIWRDFFAMILSNFPHVENGAFKPAYNHIEWRNNEVEFNLWCEGKTGYPIVDAGMRELNETGFMHNRVRMIVASFLTKHLLIDWRWGEAYFARKLFDFDLASNNGGWQWAAGSGCDASPYFRVFNPQLQTEKFDKDMKYIQKWIPEFTSGNYFPPVVEHVFARERVLKAFKKALG